MYSAVPPYHPSYGQAQGNGNGNGRWRDDDDDDYDSTGSGGDYATGSLRRRYASAGSTRVRRGSYGEIEVRTVDREEMLRKWMDDEYEARPGKGGPQQRDMNLSHLHEQGRYQTYTSQVDFDSLGDGSSDDGGQGRLHD